MSFTAFSDRVDPEKIIKKIPFRPDLNLSSFQADYRLPAEYRVSMLEGRLKLAVVYLPARKEEQMAEEIIKQAPAVKLLNKKTNPPKIANGRSCSGRGTAIPRPFFNAKIRPALVYKRRTPFPQKILK